MVYYYRFSLSNSANEQPISFSGARIKAILPLRLLLRFKFRIRSFNFVLRHSSSFSTLFNLAYRHSFSWHTSLKNLIAVWWIVKMNVSKLHLTKRKTKLNDRFHHSIDFARNKIAWWLNWLLVCRNWPRNPFFTNKHFITNEQLIPKFKWFHQGDLNQETIGYF